MSETTTTNDHGTFGAVRRPDVSRVLLGTMVGLMLLGGFSLGAAAVLPTVLLLAATAGWLALHSP